MESTTITREKILEKIKIVFEGIAIEGHLFGSIAGGTSDIYSDIDIGFTFRNDRVAEILKNRFEYYSQIGDIIHVCEPPQNAPVNGIQSSIIYKTKAGLIVVDYSLSPQSTSFAIDGSKKLFGEITLPIGELGYNPKKVIVSETYRIDFFISTIFVSIKKLLRNNENALGFLFGEYKNLKERYNIPVKELTSIENTIRSLEEVIKNIKKVANEKQQGTLVEIETFIKSF